MTSPLPGAERIEGLVADIQPPALPRHAEHIDPRANIFCHDIGTVIFARGAVLRHRQLQPIQRLVEHHAECALRRIRDGCGECLVDLRLLRRFCRRIGLLRGRLRLLRARCRFRSAGRGLGARLRPARLRCIRPRRAAGAQAQQQGGKKNGDPSFHTMSLPICLPGLFLLLDAPAGEMFRPFQNFSLRESADFRARRLPLSRNCGIIISKFLLYGV